MTAKLTTEIYNIYVLINSVLKDMDEEEIYDGYTLTSIYRRVRSYVILINESEVIMSGSDFYKIIKSILKDMKKDSKFDKNTLDKFERRFIRKKKYYE